MKNTDPEFDAVLKELSERGVKGSSCMRKGDHFVDECHNNSFLDCLGWDQGGSNGCNIQSLDLIGITPDGYEAWKVSWAKYDFAIYWFDK